MNETKTATIGENGDRIDFLHHFMEIDEICKQAGGVNDLFFEFAEPHLHCLSENLHISKTGAALFAVLINLYDGCGITIREFSESLKCPILEVMRYMDDLECLEQKGFIDIKREDKHMRFNGHDDNMIFCLRFNVINALRQGSYQAINLTKNLSINQFFAQLERLFYDRYQDRQSYDCTIKKMNGLLEDNTHLLFVRKVQEQKIGYDDTLMLLRFFDHLVTEDEQEMGIFQLRSLYEYSSDFTEAKHELKKQSSDLIKKGLIENTNGGGFRDAENFRLTELAKEEFLVELDIALSDLPVKGLKRADSITPKTLFYPEKTRRAIDDLAALLRPEQFLDVQKRLGESGMRTGFACLFSGGPGTGKTETAHQIARITGRDIMQVDIANTKSMWFGESEKQIKELFDKYRSCVKKSKTAPILLFNEADAVFGKRQVLG
ncbi:MAG: ATP-binding protein, partial [Treponema sp.]|nr:ATP-binding protein [Treponema sp.]